MRPYDMNQYRAIRNMMLYWFFRIILERGATEAKARSCWQHPAERRASERHSRKRHYWRLRNSGLSWAEAMAQMEGKTVKQIREHNVMRTSRRARRWGGYGGFGSEPYLRWLLTK